MPRASAKQKPHVLVVCAQRDDVCLRVRDELALVGLSVHVHEGDRDTARAEMDAPWDAIVQVRAEGSHSIWFGEQEPAGAHQPIVVAPSEGESTDSVALRSAELVRGRLLPENASNREELEAPPTDALLQPRPPWELSTGPTLLASSYGGTQLGWTAALSYWFDAFSIGGFATAAVTPSLWKRAENEMHQQQLTAGVLIQGRLLRTSGDRFDLSLGGAAGMRSQWLTNEIKPPDNARFRGVSAAVALSAQLHGSYALSPRVALGAIAGGTVGIPVSWPKPTDALKKKSQDALEAQRSRVNVDGLFQASAVVTFRF